MSAAQTATEQLPASSGRWFQTPETDKPLYKHIKVSRISGACGAYIRGVDLARSVDDPEVMGEIKACLLRHGVVAIKGQGHLDNAG
jgi:hypothetical protein